ncbi:MAG: WG repeat-containing protein, partial [Planctomycetes bacterium]|nr:WG repeat-containing protein [Planctomycetota bacterium]
MQSAIIFLWFGLSLADAGKGELYPFRTASGKNGFIDENGRIVIEAKFDNVRGFFDGLAKVKTDAGWSFIDRTGKTILEEPADWFCGFFSEGFCCFRRRSMSRELWGFCDRTGAVVIEPRFAEVSAFYEGLAAVKLHNNWGYVDKTGAREHSQIVSEKGACGTVFLWHNSDSRMHAIGRRSYGPQVDCHA